MESFLYELFLFVFWWSFLAQKVFFPIEHDAPEVKSCSFHMKGCCFDPEKSVDGFLAAPCFGCVLSVDGDSKKNFDD